MTLALRGLAAFGVAFAIWYGSRPVYEPALTSATNGLLQLTERTAVTSLVYASGIASIHRGGLRGQSGGTINIPFLTFNLIVFLTLAFFTMTSSRRVARKKLLPLLSGVAIVFAVHVAATWIATRTMIAISAAQQDRVAIGTAENVLFALNQGYSVIGAHAIAFALWWLLLRRDQ